MPGGGETREGTGAVVTLRPDGGGAVRSVSGTRSLTGITCVAGGNCVAVGRGNRTGVFVEIATDGTPGIVRSTPAAPELF